MSFEIKPKKEVISGISNTEVGYLDGVTSSIQTQLDDRLKISDAPSISPIFMIGGM